MTWIRARDGLLYRDPLLVFDAGFVCFADDEPAELILWLREDAKSWTRPEAKAVLMRAFSGYSVRDRSLSINIKRERRWIPGSDPPKFAPASSFWFDIDGRIPVPVIHRGMEKYIGRTLPAAVTFVDHDPDRRDGSALDIVYE